MKHYYFTEPREVSESGFTAKQAIESIAQLYINGFISSQEQNNALARCGKALQQSVEADGQKLWRCPSCSTANLIEPCPVCGVEKPTT